MKLPDIVKLIIWDLDETFWRGTLSEEGVEPVPSHIELVKKLTSRGIIQSLCSKNDYDQAREELIKLGVWDYFVFPKIEWQPKGMLVKQIIEECSLRPENVLFIDDNHLNLEEVRYYNPGITSAMPAIIPELLDQEALQGKDDREHTRLKQYKILEKKHEFKKTAVNNEEFLRKSDIKLSVQNDYLEQHIGRIYELVIRTNQLNFTKRRDSREELLKLISDRSVRTGIIHVQDRFGDYGIVGFFAIKNQTAIHFLFSCRTINLGVEQFVYNLLKEPAVNVEGNVASELKSDVLIDWIELSDQYPDIAKENSRKPVKVLLKGGCDLEQMIHYFNYKKFEPIPEYNFPNSLGMEVHREHTVQLKQSVTLQPADKETLIRRLPFYSTDIFNTSVFSDDYDILVYSLLMDYTMDLYEFTDSGLIFPYAGYTDVSSMIKRVFKERFEMYDFDSEALFHEFKNNIKNRGQISGEQFLANLKWLIEHLKGKPVIFINGAEVETGNVAEKGKALERHRKMNQLLDQFAERHQNVYILDIRKITSSGSFTNNIRHYDRKVFKRMSEELASILGEITDERPRKEYIKIASEEAKKIGKRAKHTVLNTIRKILNK